jgi:hypothetical protein
MDNSDALHRPLYCADILINALNQDPNRPLLHLLDGPTLTVSEVRDAMSRFAQALRSLGITAGTRVGLLSANRPEVLHTSHAVQISTRFRRPPSASRTKKRCARNSANLPERPFWDAQAMTDQPSITGAAPALLGDWLSETNARPLG